MISERLKVASKFLKGFNYLADCGTDHALLPIYAVEKGYVKKAIASDNKHHPLLSAKKNIADHRLYLKVNTRLADGLSYLNLEKDVDVVTIMGMGGRVMSDILEDAYLYNVKRLVLQPNSDYAQVRTFLETHKWYIVNEAFIKDNQKYYQIIVAEPGVMTLSELEKEFGPLILKEKNDVFVERITMMIEQLKRALKEAHQKDTVKKIKDRVEFLKGAIQ